MTDRKTETKRDVDQIRRTGDAGDRETRSYSPRRTPLTNTTKPSRDPKPAEDK